MNVPAPPSPRLTSYIQRSMWGRPLPSEARALRLCGEIDGDRLTAAITEVATALDVLRAGFGNDNGVPVVVPAAAGSVVNQIRLDGPPDERAERCLGILNQDRTRALDPCADPLVRFHLVELGAGETVLGLVAHPLVLDLRSIYLVLGAVMQAYFHRFRVAEYPPFEQVAAIPPGPSRTRWWSHRLEQWHRADSREPADGVDCRFETMELPLGAARWAALAQVGGTGGNTGSLAVIALLAWWFQERSPRSRRPVFGSTLDLRDYQGLGTVVGPLTDRIVFEVDLDGFADMSFRDLVTRSHVGLLDAVVHYLPYGDLVALGIGQGHLRPPRVARLWDVVVNYCPLPPASSYTREEETLARRGLSIELFREADLTRSDQRIPAGSWDGVTMELHVAESGDDMALVVNFNALRIDRGSVSGLLHDLGEVIDKVTGNPDIAVRAL